MTIAGKLPGGVVLAEGENAISAVEFKRFPLVFLKTKIILTNRRIVGECPNMPLGSTKVSFPLRNVASTGAASHIRIVQLSLGFILAILGLVLMPLGVVLTAIGLVLMIDAFQTHFQYTNNAGQTEVLVFSAFEKGRAQNFANQVNTTLAEPLQRGRGTPCSETSKSNNIYIC